MKKGNPILKGPETTVYTSINTDRTTLNIVKHFEMTRLASESITPWKVETEGKS
ncbi:MAG: hypothetical protein JXB42_12550 [Deltaproteobacteria bacterium]|nr:hypothetical protein [Deltaproteobacteria bacterium]